MPLAPRTIVAGPDPSVAIGTPPFHSAVRNAGNDPASHAVSSTSAKARASARRHARARSSSEAYAALEKAVGARACPGRTGEERLRTPTAPLPSFPAQPVVGATQ